MKLNRPPLEQYEIEAYRNALAMVRGVDMSSREKVADVLEHVKETAENNEISMEMREYLHDLLKYRSNF